MTELDAFFNHSLALLCIADKEGRFVRLNPAWETTLGWSVAELIGQVFLDFVHPDDREATMAITARVFEGGTAVAFENRYRCKDGSYRHLRWYTGVHDDEGRQHAFAQDITEQRKAEERARIYEDTILNSNIGFIVLHLEKPGDELSLRILLANDAAGRIVGFDVKAQVGQMAADVFPGNIESGLAAAYTRIAESGGSLDMGEVAYDDARIQGIFSIKVVGLPDRRVCVSFEDVTERRRTEEALRQSLIQAEVIRAQAAALAELSTPLIPIRDDVVVMPLIGTVDGIRAEQMLETLLSGVGSHGTRIAILDITGVAVVDANVANTIVRAAQAVKLLGAQVMLTGIRPEVARTLIGLDVDLGGIVTHGSLQAGIAAAFKRRGG
ncbi:PAS domain S-box protein [Polyangium aurulentum]|uniref:PAS domain S-box protein n=1 Tax=Polyangium aurulentum TaxID=2567896 RepID=UPI00146EF205|nr:PAS domain S-box protein [Polyangium aurulentum]UQA54912.1 PAS domain S-box protein [Polyangium aurulentum]